MLNNKLEKTSIAFTGDIGFDKYMAEKWTDEELISKPILDFLHSADHVCINVEGAVIDATDDGKRGIFFHSISPNAVCVFEKMKADIWSIGNNHTMDAGADDFDTEFLDYILAVKIVRDVSEAVAHIAAHSTHHSDAILTETKEAATFFTTCVDSAAVYVNASTRFTDGGQFGLGCEMGISTQKLHARGPMGLEEMTAYKYVITGNGQIR